MRATALHMHVMNPEAQCEALWKSVVVLIAPASELLFTCTAPV
jgi:hypothetical protein